MNREYKIGAYVFQTYEEYSDGLDDVNTIRYIVDNVDMDDMDVLLHLYDWMKQEKLVFKSPIGEAFFADIVERVATQSQQQLDAEKKIEDKKETTDRLRKYGGIICVIAAVICFAIYFGIEYSNYKGKKEIQHLQDLKQTSVNAPTTTLEKKGDISKKQENAEGKQEELPDILPEYQAIYQENPEFAGWLTIPDSIVDYPVMKPKNDTDYYLDHTFSGEEDKNGTLFIDSRNDIVHRSTNIIIYGHNMRSGNMFGNLDKYKSESYYKDHPMIRFDTIYEKGTYQVMYAFMSHIYKEDEIAFKYYQFIDAASEQEFDSDMRSMQEMALYDTGVTAQYGDRLLTLSTCDYEESDGRFVVVAKRME